MSSQGISKHTDVCISYLTFPYFIMLIKTSPCFSSSFLNSFSTYLKINKFKKFPAIVERAKELAICSQEDPTGDSQQVADVSL